MAHATLQRVELICPGDVPSLPSSEGGQEGTGYFPGITVCETELGQLLFVSAETWLVELQRGAAVTSLGPWDTCTIHRELATKTGMLFCHCRWSSQQLEVAAMPGGQTQMAVQQKNLGTSQKTSLTTPSRKWTMLGMWQRLRASWCP